MYISFNNRPYPPSPDGVRARRRISSVVITLGVVSLLTDISSESVTAILPLYITAALGLSTVAFGFLDGLYQGVSALVRIAGGLAADRGDQPKWVAFFGYGISAIARVGLIFATGFGAIAAVVTIDRLGKGIRTAPRDAMIAASSAPDIRAASFGMHRMLDNIGAALGPLIAFVILLLVPDGYTTVFVASLAFAIIGLAVLGLLVPNVRRRASSAERPVRPRFRWRQLGDPRLRRLLVAAGVFGLLTIGDGFIYLVLQSRGAFAAEWFPLMYVGTNIAFLAFAFPLGRLADRVGTIRIFIIGHGALLAAYIAAALPVTGAPITILCLLLLGGFYASTDGILAALASRFAPPEAMATGIAAAQTVVAVSRLVASTGFGILWFAFGRGEALIAVSVCLAVAIPVVALLLRGSRSPRVPE